MVKKCGYCDALMVERSGPYGKFWGCSTFPKCDYTFNPRSPKAIYYDTPHWGDGEDDWLENSWVPNH